MFDVLQVLNGEEALVVMNFTHLFNQMCDYNVTVLRTL